MHWSYQAQEDHARLGEDEIILGGDDWEVAIEGETAAVVRRSRIKQMRSRQAANLLRVRARMRANLARLAAAGVPPERLRALRAVQALRLAEMRGVQAERLASIEGDEVIIGGRFRRRRKRVKARKKVRKAGVRKRRKARKTRRRRRVRKTFKKIGKIALKVVKAGAMVIPGGGLAAKAAVGLGKKLVNAIKKGGKGRKLAQRVVNKTLALASVGNEQAMRGKKILAAVTKSAATGRRIVVRKKAKARAKPVRRAPPRLKKRGKVVRAKPTASGRALTGVVIANGIIRHGNFQAL